MGMNFNFNDGPLPPSNVCEPHQPILMAIDKSGSMGDLPGTPKISNVEKAINKFLSDLNQNSKVSERIDFCLLSFNEKVTIEQDWVPVAQAKTVELTAGGGTNLSEALSVSVDKLRERGHVYENNGIEVRMPYLIILTDGMGNDIDQISEVIRNRTRDNKMRPWFLGVKDYDKVTAGKITGGDRVFELTDADGYDFTDFFKLMAVSIKAVSTSAPGEKPVIKDDENPLKQEDCGVKVVNIDDWLS